MRHEITTNRLRYILSGKAKFTIANEGTKNSEDYMVDFYPGSDRYYVLSAVGTHLGTISVDANGRLTFHNQLTPIVMNLVSYKGFWWYLRQVLINEHEDYKELDNQLAFTMDFKLYHNGRCGHCGRKLTDKDSIARGLGPVCATY